MIFRKNYLTQELENLIHLFKKIFFYFLKIIIIMKYNESLQSIKCKHQS